ncbi:ABC transporter permease [Flavobacteriaceae bacterium]|jgi:putative ABC transport system permease protein|nr:ABC transporter ATP-binding protein [Flavobacteriaceae bacterium]MCP4803493.1 ABC transporter permease [Bacteroidota bacterium]MDA9551338.1 ABC transporter permease [Flavobacteriaceae bacterium]MDC0956855.1 ABC transporter permease [Flavobacteriaceae bacterium]MDC3181423.1 ABC transporter permease [Flavobacteriaceae bacterium]|tara:strand:+ start:3948 stop:5177 length:1230 start_codon:yes stop_codon:yes gene_type:complete
MFDIDLWREIFQSINKNRLRTLMSGFTVLFAIMLFTILFGIANGLQNTFTEAFGDDATNAIFIRSGTTSKASNGLQAGRRIQFDNNTFSSIKSENDDNIEYITSRIFKNVTATFRNETDNYSVRAVHPDQQFIEKTSIDEGRYINQRDLENKTKVIVIGSKVEEDLFLKTTALGKYLNLSGIQYKIVGIFSDEGNDDEERIIYMPLTTAQQVYGNNDYIDQISLTYNPKLNFDEAIAFSNKLTSELKKLFSVAVSDQRAIRVRNRASESQSVSALTTGLGIIILVIGFGTLIAGVVGISNIMIFIVKERTKEIGIRKALGAPPKSIVFIILLESILITIIAGFLGLIIGMAVLKYGGPSLEQYFIKDAAVSLNLIVAATITLIVSGGIAGYLPAKKASQIKPIIALRND